MEILNCSCGKEHFADVLHIEICEDASLKMPFILKEYKNIYLVADETTYKIIGEKAEKMLLEKGFSINKCILKKDPLPDAFSVGSVLLEITEKTDIILAVGSGTINDICRIAAFRLNLPYAVLGTAPSMDGYASNISPLVYKNTKTTFKAKTPKYIIADTKIMAHAPYEMLLAGIGDMAGKFVAILDWEVAREQTGEYYCETVAKMVTEAADKCLLEADKLKTRSTEVIESIVEGLVISGLGMAYTGVSRPASGSEHMIAHTFEIMDIEKGKYPELHGLEVAEATEISIIMYNKLFSETKDEKLKKLIGKYIDKLNKIPGIFEKCGMKRVVTEENKLREGIMNARYFRDRYTILKYIDKMGKTEEYTEFCIEKLRRQV